MKREAKKLLNKALDSLTLSIEHFNRPYEMGRSTATLIFLDHALEMLLKASIIERGGDINSKDRPGQKIGFDACVGRGLSDGNIKFLSEEQAKLCRMINGQRDAAQHYLVDISEPMLYLHIQSGVSLFSSVIKTVFDFNLSDKLPNRVLPISTNPLTDLHSLFDQEIDEVRKLLQPGRRRKLDAEARLRSLIIVDKALIGGDVQQPNRRDTNLRARELGSGQDWRDVFQGVASMDITTDGTEHQINLVLTKRGDGVPVYVDGESSFEATNGVAIIHRVNEFDRYSMTLSNLAEHLGINTFQTQAIVWRLNLKEDKEAYKKFKRGSVVIQGYSQHALTRCRETIAETTIEKVTEQYKEHRRKFKKVKQK